ncbi:Rap1a/Tai family immunity protein [Sphingopyxis macrogoltabida]
MMKSRRVGCRQAGPLTSHAMSRDGRLKMRPRQLMLFCAVLAALPGSAVGQTEPASAMGSALLASCQANEPGCGAYLQGVLDMMIVARKAECRAPRYDRAALRAAYLRWAEQNSYFMSVHMVAGAERALTEAWSCEAGAAQPRH